MTTALTTLVAVLLALPPLFAQQDATRLTYQNALATLLVQLDAQGGEDPALLDVLELRLRLHPELMAPLPELIREGRVSDGTSASVLRKLEVIGSPPAQFALRGVAADSRQGAMDRTRALIALGGLADPEAETVAFLWATFARRGDPGERDRSHTAALSLGILGRRLSHEGKASRALALRDDLVRALGDAREDTATMVLLKACGNLGDATVAEVVARYATAPRPAVRAAAAETLGRLGDAQAAVLLAERLQVEPSGIVRAALAGALLRLGSDAPYVLESMRRQVSVEPHDLARLRLVEALLEHVGGHAAIREELTHLQRRDPSPRVRAVLAHLGS